MNAKSIFMLAGLLLPVCANAQAWGYKHNRFAISADGNNADDWKDKWRRADPDDWGATPATMAIIAKLKAEDKLVHYSYNNFIEANVGPASENVMNLYVKEGIERFRFNPNLFFDVLDGEDRAVTHLAKQMAKSTAQDPLYFIHMGPSEFFYQCVEKCVEWGKKDALAYVFVISHSGYNDNHLRRPYHHTMEQAIALSDEKIQYKRIKDQNAQWDPNALWNSKKNTAVWKWMLDSKDPNINWLYETMSHHPQGHYDISDCGMLYYLLTGDEDGSPSKFKTFLGDEIVPNSYVYPKTITTETPDLLVFEGYQNQIKATILPELTSDKHIKWTSDNEAVATVFNGVVTGIKPGETKISAITQDGRKKTSVSVKVEPLKTGTQPVILKALDDFKILNVKGFAPAYKDGARQAIAIDASKYKDEYAASVTTFNGETGLYDITLKALRETDGESRYRIRVGDRLVGEFKNTPTKQDYELAFLTVRGVTIRKGEKVQIESNSASNFRIPEGDAFAFSRGRWGQVAFTPADLNLLKQQNQAIIIIEPEQYPLQGAWSKVTDQKASGKAYITYATTENQYEQPHSKDITTLDFEVKEPGTYTVKWFMRQPEEEKGTDRCNDVWINFSDATQLGGNEQLEGFHKFVSRSDENFVFGGQLDLHGKQPWMHVRFDKPGKYTLEIAGRSSRLQIDRFILFKGIKSDELESML